MENKNKIWESLVDKVKPATIPEEPIESIGVSIQEGGIKAVTLDPIPTYDFDHIDEEIDIKQDDISELQRKLDKESENMEENPEDYPENEEVFIYEDLGTDIKGMIMERLSDALLDAPVLSSCEFVRCTVTEEEISAVFELSYHIDKNWIKDDLAEILADEGRIDSSSDLAYGSIDTVYCSDSDISSFSGWTFDGTLYRYTETPFEYWSAGRDTDYPTNMDEWVEFVSESKEEKAVAKNRDKHVIHFHPMKNQLDEDDPYIQWFKRVEELSMEKYEVDEELIHSFKLSGVSVDDTGATVYSTIVL
jgi:hypothetical protein